MKAISLFDEKNVAPTVPRTSGRGTAYQIFDRANLYPFMVDLVHLRMKTGAKDIPIVHSGGRRGAEQTLDQLVPVMGTIIDMSDYYHDNASIKIESSIVAKNVYNHIVKHLNAHLTAMRTDPGYELPNDDTLEELALFGAAIHPWTLDGEDKAVEPDDFISRLRKSRPFFTFDAPTTKPKDVTVEVPSVIKHLDAIQQYIEMNQLR